MTKKRFALILSTLGAVLVVGQVVWASDTFDNKETTPVRQEEHTKHHPNTEGSTNSLKQVNAPSDMLDSTQMAEMMKSMNSTQMADMMKSMDSTEQGKQLIKQCIEFHEQTKDNN